MTSLSIFTSMTNPEERRDPWKEALNCYEEIADEVIIVGKDWPHDFKWDLIGKVFQEGFDKCNSDWVIRMDLDYFFHENDFMKIRKAISKYKDFPALSFPQYQFFTPERFQIKTRLCVAFNKKRFQNIKLNGGGDLTLATINNKLIDPKKVPNVRAPIYQYESMFRNKEIIAKDRARFSKAWFEYFGNYDDRGGPLEEEAFQAWLRMVKDRYPKHTFKMKLNSHPKFIKKSFNQIKSDQFGFDAFGLRDKTKRPLVNYLKGYREMYFNPLLSFKYKYKNVYK